MSFSLFVFWFPFDSLLASVKYWNCLKEVCLRAILERVLRWDKTKLHKKLRAVLRRCGTLRNFALVHELLESFYIFLHFWVWSWQNNVICQWHNEMQKKVQTLVEVKTKLLEVLSFKEPGFFIWSQNKIN